VLEAHGITTVSLSISRSWSEKVRAPRSVFVRFPYGAALGDADAVEQQRAVLAATVREGLALPESGGIVDLPFRWRREVAGTVDLGDLEPESSA